MSEHDQSQLQQPDAPAPRKGFWFSAEMAIFLCAVILLGATAVGFFVQQWQKAGISSERAVSWRGQLQDGAVALSAKTAWRNPAPRDLTGMYASTIDFEKNTPATRYTQSSPAELVTGSTRAPSLSRSVEGATGLRITAKD